VIDVNWQFAFQVLPALLYAARITVFATALGFAIALVGGLVLALARMAPSAPIRWPVGWFIEFVRSTPLLVQIYFVFFALPNIGIVLPALTCGVLVLGVHYSTYVAEVYRAGLESVPAGQWEAAAAVNLGPYRTFRDIILPQAIPPVVPALGNYLIVMFKETPLLAAIAVVEMLQRAKIIGSETFRYTEPITIVGLIFLALSLLSAVGIRRLERRLRRGWSP
jgi:polar amino acid transport system permease protein